MGQSRHGVTRPTTPSVVVSPTPSEDARRRRRTDLCIFPLVRWGFVKLESGPVILVKCTCRCVALGAQRKSLGSFTQQPVTLETQTQTDVVTVKSYLFAKTRY